MRRDLTAALLGALLVAGSGASTETRVFRFVAARPSGIPTPDVEALASHFRGRLGPSLVFRQLESGEVAFREASFELKLLSYTPVMHGLLLAVPGSTECVVEGRANWFSLAFSLWMASFVLSRPEAWPILLVLVALVGGIEAVQATTYREVAKFAVEGVTAQQRDAGSSTWRGRVSTAVLLALLVMGAAWYMMN